MPRLGRHRSPVADELEESLDALPEDPVDVGMVVPEARRTSSSSDVPDEVAEVLVAGERAPDLCEQLAEDPEEEPLVVGQGAVQVEQNCARLTRGA